VLASVGAPVVAGLSAVAAAGPASAALAALDALPVARRAGRVPLALFVGLTYLTAAYFAQMAFKEVILAALVLAFALVLGAAARAARAGRRAAMRAALAPAVLMAGMMDTLSWPGLLWPLATLAACVALAAPAVRRDVRTVGAAALSGAVAVALLVAAELPRAVAFQGSHYAHEPAEGLGNLPHPLPPNEALGVWLRADFRFPPHLPLLNDVLVLAAAALAVIGVAGWLRRPGGRALAGALAGGWLVWAGLAVTQNGYNAAKGLVVVSPLVALAVVSGAAAAWSARPAAAPEAALRYAVIAPAPASAGRRAAIGATVAAVLCAGGISSAWALRDAAVGPDAHHRELRELAAVAPPGPMLVLDSSDFIAWDLYGVDVWRPPLIYVVHTAPLRRTKPHGGGQPFDLDSATSATLNRFASVITARNDEGSIPPPGLRVLRRTQSYVLWKRVGTIPPRETLGEGWQAGKVLDCAQPSHRAISRLPGWAIVRPPPVIATAPGWHGDARHAGSTATRTLSLPPGRWDISMQYVSRNAIDVTVGGRTTTLPANLDRLGPLFAAGTTPGGRQATRVHVHGPTLFARLLGASSRTHAFDSHHNQPLGAVVATRRVPPQRVPLSHACGRYVDSYKLRR
jgi:hypothetical protein